MSDARLLEHATARILDRLAAYETLVSEYGFLQHHDTCAAYRWACQVLRNGARGLPDPGCNCGFDVLLSRAREEQTNG